MTAEILSEPPPLEPMRRISPSRYVQLSTCMLSEIWASGTATPFLPRNPMAIIGSIAHEVLLAGANGGAASAEETWDQLVGAEDEKLRASSLERCLYPLRTSVRLYEVVRKRTCQRAASNPPENRIKRPGTPIQRRRTGHEIWVKSRDEAVGGWIDLVERIDEEIVLSDLKAGDAAVRESYAVQLKIYAALYHETFGEWPSRIQIVPLNGAPSVVPLSRNECSRLLVEASTVLAQINDRVSSGTESDTDLAAPSPAACRQCGFRPVCRAYHAAPKNTEEKWPADALGQVWDINLLLDGKKNLRVRSNTGSDLIFRALSLSQHQALNLVERGDHIGLFDARRSGGSPEFTEGPTTVIYRFSGSFVPTK